MNKVSALVWRNENMRSIKKYRGWAKYSHSAYVRTRSTRISNRKPFSYVAFVAYRCEKCEMGMVALFVWLVLKFISAFLSHARLVFNLCDLSKELRSLGALFSSNQPEKSRWNLFYCILLSFRFLWPCEQCRRLSTLLRVRCVNQSTLICIVIVTFTGAHALHFVYIRKEV